jgi:peptide/nickel transport system permease protein
MAALSAELEPRAIRASGRPSRRSRVGRSAEIWVPAAFLLLLVLACYLWPLVGGVPSPVNANPLSANLPIGSPGHVLGTDPLGNDIFSRLLYGGRVSIEVGLGSNVIGLVVGGAIGIAAAYRGGWPEAVVMRVLDVLIAFPSLVLALAIAQYLGPGELNVIWALSFFSVPAYARLARAQTLRLREQDLILAARLSGAKDGSVLARHLVPNVVPQLLTFASLGISVTIILEASLSYLGLGVRLPQPSWGDMISQGQQYLSLEPRLVLVPSAVLLVTVVAINVLGDGVRARMATR